MARARNKRKVFQTPDPADGRPPRPALGEVAIADTRRITSLGPAAVDWNPDELVRRKGGLGVYDRMAEDEQVKACLMLKKSAVVGPGWRIEPGGETPADEALAEQISDDLQSLHGTFEDALLEVLSGLTYGFSLTEKVWRLDGGRVRLAALKARAPHHLEFAQDPFGNVTWIEQRSSGRTQPQLPPDKFIHYVNSPEFSNPYGRSDCREAYAPWWHKSMWRQWAAIFGEQLAVPIPKGTHPRAAAGPSVSAFLDKLEKLQARTAFTLPEGWDVSLIESQRNVREVFVAMLDRLDLAICKAMLMPDKIGTAGGAVEAGSFALAKEQMGAFYFVLTLIARRLEATIQEQLIVQMAALVAPAADPPTFRLNPLTEENKQAITTLWNASVGAGTVLPDFEDENHVRRLLGFPEIEPEERARRQAERDARAQVIARPADEDDDESPPRGGGKPGRATTMGAWDEGAHPREPAGSPEGGQFGPGGGSGSGTPGQGDAGSGGGGDGAGSAPGRMLTRSHTLPPIEARGAFTALVRAELEDADLPDAHHDGLAQIKFETGVIRANTTLGVVEAYGIYDTTTREITLQTNANRGDANIHTFGGATVLHEIGHHVHTGRLTREAADEWGALSQKGSVARISAYARTNQGEHFAEAYRAYARGGHSRAKLKALEPDSYKYMGRVFRSPKVFLPSGQFAPPSEFEARYRG